MRCWLIVIPVLAAIALSGCSSGAIAESEGDGIPGDETTSHYHPQPVPRRKAPSIQGKDVVYFDTEKSAALFDTADVKQHFWTVCRFFVSEEFATYCGIASGVTVLNSLGVAAPDDPQIYPYKAFTQDNFFTDEVLKIWRPREVEKNGVTLDQLARMLSVFDVGVDVHRAGSLSVDRCRTLLVEALRSPQKRVIIDFNRKALGQEGNGHFSPLVAYHAGEDRFLLMDVARYKLPPCWVKTELLYRAMTEADPALPRGRGFLIVTRR